jgi:hypothetical protein
MMLAGTGPIETSPEQKDTQNMLFEGFSWVPPGFSLGPHNRLAKLNDQHNVLRFGMEPMSQPRAMYPSNMPHRLPAQFYESVAPAQIVSDMMLQQLKSSLAGYTTAQQLHNPTQIMPYDYNAVPSSQTLQRRTPALTQPIVNNLRHYLPSFDGSGAKTALSNPFRDIWRGTRNYPMFDAGRGLGFN